MTDPTPAPDPVGETRASILALQIIRWADDLQDNQRDLYVELIFDAVKELEALATRVPTAAEVAAIGRVVLLANDVRDSANAGDESAAEQLAETAHRVRPEHDDEWDWDRDFSATGGFLGRNQP